MDDVERGNDRYMALHRMLWDEIGARRDSLGRQVIAEPEFIAAEQGYSDARLGDDFPVLRYLDQVLDAARACGYGRIADALATTADMLPWSQNPAYTLEIVGTNLLNGYAYAGLSGPEAPIRCISPRGGFFLMGPEVLYPGHNHAPREFYLPMTPGTEWRLDDGDWFAVEAGELIYHAPWQMHAMRTRTQPLLAYVTWLDPGDRRDIGWGGSGAQA